MSGRFSSGFFAFTQFLARRVSCFEDFRAFSRLCDRVSRFEIAAERLKKEWTRMVLWKEMVVH